jgi:two-component system chemotaxis response regulator CheY
LNKDITILVVDDFATIRQIIKNFLKELGFKNVIEADDGVTAIPILKKKVVDLLITDWNMPAVSGIELLRFVRASKKIQCLPVLMVTAEANRHQIIQAAEAGVNGYIVKPFNCSLLEDKIHTIFERLIK